ncbi:MAG TPA: hypothetical protein VFF04_00800 [Candidatus Babeliales bacterium]|nr:hypothetical protein [Candidatus Babeliales bacterium]
MDIKKISLFIFLPILILVSGCGRKAIRAKALMNLHIGMTKDQVVKALGRYPDVHRGSMINKYGQIVDVWEYSVASEKTAEQIASEAILIGMTFGLLLPIAMREGHVEYYWLFFHNNTLVKWGRAGDWDEAHKQIYEIRYESKL